MPAYVCRWPNGDFSVVQASNKDEAAILLDEVANADGCPLFAIPQLMLHFKLTDEGKLMLEGVGGDCSERFWGKVYPYLNEALSAEMPEELLQPRIQEAVGRERQRVNRTIEPNAADMPQALREQIEAKLCESAEREAEKSGKLVRFDG